MRNNKEKRLVTNNFIEYNECIYLWSGNYNALFSYSKTSDKLRCLSGKCQIDNHVGALYSKIIKYKQKIVGIPLLADAIMVYDIELDEMIFIELGIMEWGNSYAKTHGKFYNYVIDENHLYMIGYCSSYVVKVNLETNEIVDIIDLFLDFEIPIEERYICFKGATVVEGYIYIPAFFRNSIFILDTNTMTVDRIVVEENKGGFSDIIEVDGNIWLAPRLNEALLQWDLFSKEIKQYKDFPKGYERVTDGTNILCMTYCNEKIWLIPCRANKIISLLLNEDGRMKIEEEFNAYYDSLESSIEVVKYSFVQSNDTKIYTFCRETNEFLVFDTITNTLEKFYIEVSEKEYFEKVFQLGYTDETSYDINLFFENLQKKEKKQERSQFGKIIFASLTDGREGDSDEK